MKKSDMTFSEVVARVAAFCGAVYGIMWMAGIEIRSPSNRAADVFLEATKPGEKLLEEGRITVGGIGTRKISAWVTHVQHSQFRPMKVSCEFYADGRVQAHSETAVTLRYASQVWAYDVTIKIDEEITRCQYFETAAREIMQEAVSKGSWKTIPTFNYDAPAHWFWRRGLYLTPNIFGKTEPVASQT